MDTLSSHLWWAWLIRGLISIVFASIAFALPVGTLATLIIFFSSFMFIDGIFSIFSLLFKRTSNRPWWIVVLEGLVGIGIGLITYFMPGLTSLALVYWVATWAIVTGIMEIISAVELRKIIAHEWAVGLMGILSVLMGVLFILAPAAGFLSLAYILGTYALFAGIMMLSLALRLRRIAHESSNMNHPSSMRHA